MFNKLNSEIKCINKTTKEKETFGKRERRVRNVK